MANYSNTKISTFEQCRYKYDLKYNKGIKSYKNTIEAFMGSMVHETLEKLYTDLRYMKKLSLDELLGIYNQKWKENFTHEIIIAKKEYTADNYRLIGEDCIRKYYLRFDPFDQETIIGLETNDFLDLGDGNTYSVRIDKFSCKGNDYYVCDYKTESRMRTKDDADHDRQLSMYAKWVRETYPDAENIYVLWHMLRFDKDLVAERTDTEMDEIFENTKRSIKEIESCTEWPTNPGTLCDYCDYKGQCPEFTHLIEIENMTPEEISEDAGVGLVDLYAQADDLIDKNKEEIKKLEAEKENLKNEIVCFAEKKDITCVYGTDHKISIKRSQRITYEDKDRLESVLKEKGLYDDLSSISYPRLNSKIKKGDIDSDIKELAHIEDIETVSLSKIKTKKE
ncbi:MAG: PD-(D/E)XK nuclease family protein [Candidatus Methanomethylophilaceae archaeon]|jgi:RecB family exonuclease